MPSKFDQRLAALDGAHEREFAQQVRIDGRPIPAIYDEQTIAFENVTQQVYLLEVQNQYIPDRGFASGSQVVLEDGRRLTLEKLEQDATTTTYRLHDV